MDQTNPSAYIGPRDTASLLDIDADHSDDDVQVHQVLPRRPDRSIATIDNTHITIINATPYTWRRTSESSRQLKKWGSQWPEVISPGEVNTMQVQLSESFSPKKSTAQVTYRLENTTVPMSFQLQYREGRRHKVYVRYLEKMRSQGSVHGSEHNLGFSRSPGGVGFIIAGTEDRFVSADPPTKWMQSQLDIIGSFPLREIAMTRSHHTGAYKINKLKGVATPKNTQTQRMPLYEQLKEGGIRVIDLRPSFHGKHFWESHGDFVAGLWNGLLGATVDEMVSEINRFNDDHPGELIIVDINPTASSGSKFRDLNSEERENLYAELMKLNHRRDVSASMDVTRLTLNQFIANKQPAVLVRVHSSWINKGGAFPGAKQGFVTEQNFPVSERWSDMDDAVSMAGDQIEYLQKLGSSRESALHKADWILTQQGLGIVFPLDSIPDLARGTWQTMHSELWPAMNDQLYPNWLSLDDIHNAQLKSFVMAINHCFVARMCGPLGSKVEGSRVAV